MLHCFTDVTATAMRIPLKENLAESIITIDRVSHLSYFEEAMTLTKGKLFLANGTRCKLLIHFIKPNFFISSTEKNSIPFWNKTFSSEKGAECIFSRVRILTKILEKKENTAKEKFKKRRHQKCKTTTWDDLKKVYNTNNSRNESNLVGYKIKRSKRWKKCTVEGFTWIRRWLMHWRYAEANF